MKKYLFIILFLIAGPVSANEYFDASSYQVTPGTRALSSSINNFADAVETGTDKLPTEAQLKNDLQNYDSTDSGSANTVVVELPYTAASYTDGMKVVVKVAATNTGASTIDVDSLGAKSIRRQDGTALVAGDLVANKISEFRYNSTSDYFEIQGSPVGSAGAGTMSTQNASSVAITGGSIDVTTLTKGGVNVPTISESATFSNKNFSQDGTINISNTGDSDYQHIARFLSPNLSTTYTTVMQFGVENAAYNSGELNFYYAGDGSSSNRMTVGLQSHPAIWIDGSENVGIGKVSEGSLLDVDGEIKGNSLDINGDGGATITDTGSTSAENPISILTPNGTGSTDIYFGKEKATNNSALLRFSYIGDGDNSNDLQLFTYAGSTGFRQNRYGNVGIGKAAAASGGAKLDVNGTIDFTGIESGATKTELNQLDGVTVGGSSSGDIVDLDSSQILSGKNFSQDGPISITDTGSTTTEALLNLRTPNLDDNGTLGFTFGVDDTSYNQGNITFYHISDGNALNYVGIGIYGLGDGILRVDASNNVGIGKTSGGAKLDVNGTIDFTGIESGATKTELNRACDGTLGFVQAINSGGDTWNTVPSIAVQTSSVGTVVAGDMFLVSGWAKFTKTTTGYVSVSLSHTSATAIWTAKTGGYTIDSWQSEVADGKVVEVSLTGIVYITTGGTIGSFTVTGTVPTGSASVSSGDAGIQFTKLRSGS